MKGYVVCECGKYAYVYSSELLKKINQNYHGEFCEKCKQWVCSIDALRDVEEESSP